jgi:hypothetical protein
MRKRSAATHVPVWVGRRSVGIVTCMEAAPSQPATKACASSSADQRQREEYAWQPPWCLGNSLTRADENWRPVSPALLRAFERRLAVDEVSAHPSGDRRGHRPVDREATVRPAGWQCAAGVGHRSRNDFQDPVSETLRRYSGLTTDLRHPRTGSSRNVEHDAEPGAVTLADIRPAATLSLALRASALLRCQDARPAGVARQSHRASAWTRSPTTRDE